MKDKKRSDADVLDAIRARDIVKEILDYGVNETQKKKIIKFLSMELEDRDAMIRICNVIDGEKQTKIEI